MRQTEDKTKNKTTWFLTGGILAILALCALIFALMTIGMSRRSQNTIQEVGELYMSGTSQRIAGHFETIINTRFSYVNTIIETVSPDSVEDLDTLREQLAYQAEIRGLEYLALATEDGDWEVKYGRKLAVKDEEVFLAAIENGEKKVTVGTDNAEDGIMLLGLPAEYPMENGGTSTGLVAGISMDNVKDILSLDEKDQLVFSHVIYKDGTFVIRSSDAVRKNYFDRIRDLYEPLNGKTPEQYVQELAHALETEEDYSVEFMMEGERRYLYCFSLPYCDWYLLTIMPYGELDETIAKQSRFMIAIAIGSCAILLAAILALFGRYVWLLREQMQKLREAQQMTEAANRAKSEFLSNMSHDIRTPMNAIVGMTAIAAANLDNPEQVGECLKKVETSGKHLLGLINDVLDMSKIESGKMTLNLYPVSMREVLDCMVSIVQPQVKVRNQKFNVSVHDVSVEQVLCDGVRLNQVIINLLSNAVKFTPDGGSVSVELWEEPSPKGENYIRIFFQVKDTGIGMTEEFQKKMFSAFVREDSARVNKTEGTGLGMAITKYIVDAMKGTIEVESKLGEGTLFRVSLDVERSPEAEEEMRLPECTILIVDDDPSLCMGAAEFLREMGAHAEYALDGAAAIRMMKEHGGYQAVLLDWKLPGMDGVETAKEIRRCFGREIPILLISSYDRSDVEESAKDAEINGILAKPLFKSTLFYGLKKYVAESEEAEKPEEPEKKRIDFSGKRILLAEDNELNWEVAEALLEDLGLVLDWAENGKICADKFQESPLHYYDAVLMDLRMPVMNGYEAADAIRTSGREDSDIPIIAMTADVFVEDVERCKEHGMNGHAAKPVNIEEISDLLQRLWDKQ